MISDQKRLWDTFPTRKIFENVNRETLPEQFVSICAALVPSFQALPLGGMDLPWPATGAEGRRGERERLVINNHCGNPAVKTTAT